MTFLRYCRAVPGLAAILLIGAVVSYAIADAETKQLQPTLVLGQGKNGDFTSDAPGIRHKITQADLPAPYASPSAEGTPRMVKRPDGAWPRVPAGFKVEEYATNLNNPRMIRTAPNGDLFIAESGPNRIKILRGLDSSGRAETTSVFAEGLNKPFGINFYPAKSPRWVYVANTDNVIRFPYKDGDLKASGPPEVVIEELPGYVRLHGGGHWTRDIVFSPDSSKMYVSVGSRTNDLESFDAKLDDRRAVVMEYSPEGKNERVFASGLRNAVSLAFHPKTGEMWSGVQERDGFGDDLVPDYVTRIKDGAYYGWPWFYSGANEDPKHTEKHPELKGKVASPDVLLQSHSACMCIAAYTGKAFPKQYQQDFFLAFHGSSNRETKTGYKVVRIPLKNGVSNGEYEDFMTGFVNPDGRVWGRLVGVTTGKDGALYLTDDGSGTVWRVSYTGSTKSASR